MPVEFLTDDEAAAYGRYTEVPSQADLERVFFLDDEDRALAGRRRDIKARPQPARRPPRPGPEICHGRKGELHDRYQSGLEDQLGALGLVLNCVVLWTTVYLDAAVRQLRAQGHSVLEEDLARLSPFVSTDLGIHGTYSFVLPDLAPGAIRELRDPDAADEDDE